MIFSNIYYALKLTRTCINYRVLGTSTAAIFILMTIFSMHGWLSYLISYIWDQQSCEVGKRKVIKNGKLLSTMGLEQTTLRLIVRSSND